MNHRIKETRKQLHLTQMEFAKLLGMIFMCFLLSICLCIKKPPKVIKS